MGRDKAMFRRTLILVLMLTLLWFAGCVGVAMSPATDPIAGAGPCGDVSSYWHCGAEWR